MSNAIEAQLEWVEFYRGSDANNVQAWAEQSIGKHGEPVARAVAVLQLGEQNEMVYSPIFGLVAAADPAPPPEYADGTIPIAYFTGEYQGRQNALMHHARRTMTKTQRSPHDMEMEVVKLQNECQRRQNEYQEEQVRVRRQRAAHDTALSSLLSIHPEWLSDVERAHLKGLLADAS